MWTKEVESQCPRMLCGMPWRQNVPRHCNNSRGFRSIQQFYCRNNFIRMLAHCMKSSKSKTNIHTTICRWAIRAEWHKASWCTRNASDPYLWGDQFEIGWESSNSDWGSYHLLSPYKQMLRWYLKLGHNSFLPVHLHSLPILPSTLHSATYWADH
jgi:hypothetical protein